LAEKSESPEFFAEEIVAEDVFAEEEEIVAEDVFVEENGAEDVFAEEIVAEDVFAEENGAEEAFAEENGAGDSGVGDSGPSSRLARSLSLSFILRANSLRSRRSWGSWGSFLFNPGLQKRSRGQRTPVNPIWIRQGANLALRGAILNAINYHF
jgi:hypothetical protein